MRISCITCGKSVSTEVPENTIIRAVAECPECCGNTDTYSFEDLRIASHSGYNACKSLFIEQIDKEIETLKTRILEIGENDPYKPTIELECLIRFKGNLEMMG